MSEPTIKVDARSLEAMDIKVYKLLRPMVESYWHLQLTITRASIAYFEKQIADGAREYEREYLVDTWYALREELAAMEKESVQ